MENNLKWTIIARYCSSNAWIIPRWVSASSAEEAKYKAEKRFPKQLNGYQLTQISVAPYTEKYKTFTIDTELYENLPKLRRYKNHPQNIPDKVKRQQKARH